MKKIIISLLSMTMLLSTSFSLTSCDSDDVEQVVQVAAVVVNAWLGNNNDTSGSIDNTAWVAQSDNATQLFYFNGGNTGNFFQYSGGKLAGSSSFGYSYDSSNNTLTIGQQSYTVASFKAQSELVLQDANGGQVTLSYYTAEAADALSGTAWYIQLKDGSYLLYYFAQNTSGALLQYESDGETVKSQVEFSYTLDANTYILTIKYNDGDMEQWIVAGVNDEKQLILLDIEGNQYAFNPQEVNGGRSIAL